MRLIFTTIFFVSLSLAILPTSQQQQQTFSPGQTIVTAGGTISQITSSNFSLGFSQLSPSRYALGIWYSLDTTRFLLWKPLPTVLSTSGSTLRLTSDGNLVLQTSDSSSSPIWSSATGGLGIASAALLDTGSFILRNTSGSILWETFQNPSNTLLPNQSLVVNGPNLTSDSNPYSLSMDSSGNLTLRWNQISYWSSDTAGSPPPTIAALDPTGVLRLFYNSSSSRFVKEIFAADYGPGSLRRLTLDSDGNLRWYTLAPPASWIQQWQATDVCSIFNYCGAYGICSYRAVQPGAATCDCPPGLGFVNASDRNAGCTGTGDVAQRCTVGDNRMLEANRTAWLSTGAVNVFNSNREQCRSTCLASAGCFGLLVPNDGSGLCIQIVSRVMSGFSSDSIESSSYVKVCNEAGNSPPTMVSQESVTGGGESTGVKVGVAVVVTVLGVVLLEVVVGWVIYRRRRRVSAKRAARDAILDYASGTATRFTYKELQTATKNFNERIGEGGFGAVYKGYLPQRKTPIAVKKLEGAFQGEKEFRMEMATIGSTHHVNLMHLVGFCSEGEETRLLVYDFIPHGSLDRFLFRHPHDRAVPRGGDVAADVTASTSTVTEDFSEAADELLDWKVRFRVALGTAKGIAYLHEECRETIVHCDLKPENILLDESFSPKVTDFGLARLIHEDTARSLTTIRGTRGYMAPEWLANMPVTTKSDVYSYGMILLELVGGRRNFDSCSAVPRERHRYPAWVYREMEAGRVVGVVDERIDAATLDVTEVERVIKVAFWCIQESSQTRPSMSKVVQMLEGNVQVVYPPVPRSLADSSSSSSTSLSVNSSAPSSSVSSSMPSLSYSSGASGGFHSMQLPR